MASKSRLTLTMGCLYDHLDIDQLPRDQIPRRLFEPMMFSSSSPRKRRLGIKKIRTKRNGLKRFLYDHSTRSMLRSMSTTSAMMRRATTTVQLHHRSMAVVFHRPMEKFDDLDADRRFSTVLDWQETVLRNRMCSRRNR
jgi:hypothetical protein